MTEEFDPDVQPFAIITDRVEDKPGWDELLPGSTKGTCHRCHHKVWLSPSTQEHADHPNARVVCMACSVSLLNRMAEAER